jgi:7-cyano-7-deazaguanine synthase in queuosine biosynthesis
MSIRRAKGSLSANLVSAESMRQAIQQAFIASEAKVWNTVISATTGELSPIVADLLDVARALFLADCRQKRSASWKRSMTVMLTVREPARWKQKKVLDALSNALEVAGGDTYTIRIAAGPALVAEISPCLPFEMPYRVCLFSDGLDSLCGLTQRLVEENGTSFFAVSGLTQYQVERRIRESVADLNRLFDNRVVSVPISLYRRGYRQRTREEPSQRSRSVLLLILGAVVALMAGQNHVEVFENGIEVFNFPLAPDLEPERLSRAMHPLLLARMSDFVSTLVEAPFEFKTPFAFHTKTEMLRASQEHLPAERIRRTISCIRYRSTPCGYCAGCMLRRQAFYHTGLTDSEARYRFDIFSGKRAAGVKTAQDRLENPIYAMNHGVYNLGHALSDPNPFRALMTLSGVNCFDREEFLSATARVSSTPRADVQERLLDLYRRYAREWEGMRPHVHTLPRVSKVSMNSEEKREEVSGV